MKPIGQHWPVLTAFLLSAAVVSAIWLWLARPTAIVAVPEGRFNCLSYVPTHPGGDPLRGQDYEIPPLLIERDLAALLPLTGCIRTYSSYGVQGQVLPVAARMEMKVLLGIWISADDARNQMEIDAALKVAAQHPDAVRAIVVGNEVMLRREMTGERLASVIESVKARTVHPVAYADIYEFWRRNPAVAQAADKLLVHVLPYWDDPTPVSIDDVQEQVRTVVDRMRAAYPHKDLEIGEIGWPSAGRTRGHAVPNRVNQARFMREFAAQARALGIRYNLIEAIDQSWKKVPEGTVGGFWGLLNADRELKFPLSGPVREWSNPWPGLLISVGLSALFLGTALFAGREPALLSALGIGFSGAATGTCLSLLYVQIESMATGGVSLLWGTYLLVVAATGGLFLGAQAAGLPAAWRQEPSRLGEVLAGCRRRALAPAQILGLFRWGVLLPAGFLAVSLAVDGRHRDFLTLAFVLPALALAMQAWTYRGDAKTAEDAWISLLIGIAGPMSVEAFGNREAFAWAGTCVLLALPGWPAITVEARRLARIFAAIRQQDNSQHDRNR